MRLIFILFTFLASFTEAQLGSPNPVAALTKFNGYSGLIQPGGKYCNHPVLRDRIAKAFDIPDHIKNFATPEPVEVSPTKGKIEFSKDLYTEVSIVDMEHLKRIVKQMGANTFLPNDYPENGCYARAHLMSMMLEKQGILTGKVFSQGELKVDAPSSPKGYVEWDYHVAPTVLVKENGKLEIYVIDPSLADIPLKRSEWAALQVQRSDSQLVALYDRPRFTYMLQTKRRSIGEIINTSGYLNQDIQETFDTLMKYHPESQRRKESVYGP